MRTAYQNVDFIFDEHDESKLIGINFGFDYVAEHEQSELHGIRQAFGIPLLTEVAGSSKILGIDRYLATAAPAPSIHRFDSVISLNGLHFFEFKHQHQHHAVLLLNYSFFLPKNTDLSKLADESYLRGRIKKHMQQSCKYMSKKNMHSQWGSDGFMLCLTGQDKVDLLKQIHAMMKNKQMAIGMRINGFLRSGLVFLDANSISDEDRESIRITHLEQNALLKDVQNSGIEKILRKANLNWYCLSPYYGEGKALMFYLNPHNQKLYNDGRFSLDDLKAWAKGTGPVVK